MKLSRYNFLRQYDDATIFFNATTCALAVVDENYSVEFVLANRRDSAALQIFTQDHAKSWRFGQIFGGFA